MSVTSKIGKLLTIHTLIWQAKKAFALLKTTRFASSQVMTVLSTLIPPNVLQKIAEFERERADEKQRGEELDTSVYGRIFSASPAQNMDSTPGLVAPWRSGGGSTGAELLGEISHATMLFAQIVLGMHDTVDFAFVSALFSAFDDAVEAAGMFKYQRVATGSVHSYIVGCPRVAAPYDKITQGTAYPAARYYMCMAKMCDTTHFSVI